MVFAADATSSSGSWLAYLPLLVIAVLLYFVLIRPQSKRRREAMNMQSTIGPGDEVQTIGGLYGTVTEVDDDSTTIEAAPGVHLRFAKTPSAAELHQAIDTRLSPDAWFQDVHGSAPYKRHVTFYLAEQVRAELS